jgi:capsular polysaccharide biosynthesis protein
MPRVPYKFGTWEAARRYPLLVAIPLLVMIAIAAGIATARTPTYTATSTLIVGQLDLSAPGAVSGFESATQSLAAGYSRSIAATQVVNPVAQALRLTPGQVRGHLSSTPFTNAPVFKVQAKASSEPFAIRLANTAAGTLISYVTKLNSTNPDVPRLYARFQDAALDYAHKLRAQQQLQARTGRSGGTAAGAAIDRAVAATDAALLRREALRQAYQATQIGQSSTSLVQVLAPASFASSDRTSIFELALVLGVVAGLIIGLALATLRANAVTRRPTLYA